MQDCGAGFERVRKWGLDLAGRNGLVNSLEGAGAIGGLLAVYDLNDTPGAEQTGDDLQYIYAYDGNGNVVQVLDWTVTSPPDAIVAEYEYDAYGNLLNSPPPPQQSYYWRNPFRFSTKYWDDETGLGYWGYRYYSSRMGRWISRDPIEEEGDFNLYHLVRNNPIDSVDALGTSEICLRAPIICGCPPDGCPVDAPPEPPGGSSWPPHDRPPVRPAPPGGWKPGWLWGRPRCPGVDYEYPDSDWTEGIKNSWWARQLSLEGYNALVHALRGTCAETDCCKRAGTKSMFYWSLRAEDAAYQSYGAVWWHIGSIHLKMSAVCNTEIGCSTCKFSCSITRQFWDSWHWGLDRKTCAEAFTKYNWYLSPTYSVQYFEMPCAKRDGAGAK